jgi:hypothetical protein
VSCVALLPVDVVLDVVWSTLYTYCPLLSMLNVADEQLSGQKRKLLFFNFDFCVDRVASREKCTQRKICSRVLMSELLLLHYNTTNMVPEHDLLYWDMIRVYVSVYPWI